MERVVVRAVVSGFIGVIVGLSAPLIAWAALPNGAEKSTTANYAGWWEQWIVKDRVKFLYNPNDFIAGGEEAYVEIQDLSNSKIAIDFAKSDFVAQERGLSKKDIASELNGFYVRIAKTVRTGHHPYRVEFACRPPARSCPSGIFYVPVKNHDDQLLELKLKSDRLHIPVVAETSEFRVELTARKPIYRVRLIPDTDPWRAAGVASFELREASADGSLAIKQVIDEISPGKPFHGWLRVTRENSLSQTWNRLVSDWRGSPPELVLTLEYTDEYDRPWMLWLPPSKFDYELPPWGTLLYYVTLLGLATFAGIVGRFVAGAAVGSLRTQARGWLYSLLLAIILCVLGIVLRPRIEPAGLFQLDFTNLRGILTTGIVAGLVPEIIRKRIQGIVGRPANDADLPRVEAPETQSQAPAAASRTAW
jgi:hypothetical protein